MRGETKTIHSCFMLLTPKQSRNTSSSSSATLTLTHSSSEPTFRPEIVFSLGIHRFQSHFTGHEPPTTLIAIVTACLGIGINTKSGSHELPFAWLQKFTSLINYMLLLHNFRIDYLFHNCSPLSPRSKWRPSSSRSMHPINGSAMVSARPQIVHC